MKFIDPLITLKHMGGYTVVHLILAIYSCALYIHLKAQADNHLAFAINQHGIADKIYKFGFQDVKYMAISHIVCIILIMLKELIESVKFCKNC